MKPMYWFGLAVLVAAAGFWFWNYLTTPYTAEQLAAMALSSSDQNVRINAAVELSMRKEPEALVQLRNVAKESKDPEVIVRVIGSLPGTSGVENMSICLSAMASDNLSIRQEALVAFRRVVGISVDVAILYDPDDPDDVRREAIKKLSEKYTPKPRQKRVRKGPQQALAPPTN